MSEVILYSNFVLLTDGTVHQLPAVGQTGTQFLRQKGYDSPILPRRDLVYNCSAPGRLE